MNMDKTALVLGASGGIGGEVARKMVQQGWRVRALKRNLGSARELRDGIEWLDGDAMQGDTVRQAATGCSVIVHAVNPPGYRNWAGQVLPMLSNTIAAATEQQATVVLPGTLYNFGPDAFPLLREDSPQHPVTRKGKIRGEMEARLRDAAVQGKLRVIVVRAGDFFGPGARNNWFSQGMVKPGKVPTRIDLPGQRGVGHQFAYLPDVAATMLALLDIRERLEAFASFHMVGHWDEDGTEIGQAVQRVLAAHGAKAPKLAAAPWWLIRLAAPFHETFREMLEMRYLWQQEVRMANDRLRQVLGSEPHTPLDLAIERTLESMACLPRHALGQTRRLRASEAKAVAASGTA